jgi:hypothetical protein
LLHKHFQTTLQGPNFPSGKPLKTIQKTQKQSNLRERNPLPTSYHSTLQAPKAPTQAPKP